MLAPFPTSTTVTPGKGRLIAQCYGDKCTLSSVHAQYPLKFIPSKGNAPRLAVVYMLSYGGGVVSGDIFDVSIDVEPHANLLLLTQGNTKIFKVPEQQQQRPLPATQDRPANPNNSLPDHHGASPEHRASSRQFINAHVAADGTLLHLPDPVTAFQNSSFASHQTIRLTHASSQLVLLDWFTSGRLSRGETWSFKHYSSRIDVHVEGKLALRDHMVLEDTPGATANTTTSYAARLQPYTCFATLIIIAAGPPLQHAIETIKAKSASEQLMSTTRPRSLMWSSSPFLRDRGVLVRVAGITTEEVRNFVKYQCLDHLKAIIGDGMFSKILM